ncbi:MAG: hypothetical protein ABIG64_09930 [Candidatus Omnitrophota bacterium]
MKEIIQDKDNILFRGLFTLFIVIFIRIIYFVPIPGVDFRALIDFYQQYIQTQGADWFDFMALLHVGKLRSISVMSLGIMPFMNACIIIQIIGFLIPGVNRSFLNQKIGLKRIFFLTILVMLVLSLFHSFSVIREVEFLDKFPEFNILNVKGVTLKVAVCSSIICAVIVLILLAELINRNGIGNGVGIIFASEIIIRMFFAIDQSLLFYDRRLIDIRQLVLFFIVFCAFVILAHGVMRFKRKIKFLSYREENFSIAIRPFWVGVWPLIMAEVVLSFFGLVLNWNSFFIICLTIICFNFLYLKIIYDPRRFYELILAYKCKLKSRGFNTIEDALNNAVLITAFLSIFLFIAMYFLPILLPLKLKVSFISAGIFSAFGIIILIGVQYDIEEQIRFFRKIKSFPVKKWVLLSRMISETEAEIKKATLNNCQIIAEIKKSHFYWGLPINTVGSGYYLFVPADQNDQAQVILAQLHKDWIQKAI